MYRYCCIISLYFIFAASAKTNVPLSRKSKNILSAAPLNIFSHQCVSVCMFVWLLTILFIKKPLRKGAIYIHTISMYIIHRTLLVRMYFIYKLMSEQDVYLHLHFNTHRFYNTCLQDSFTLGTGVLVRAPSQTQGRCKLVGPWRVLSASSL